LFEIKDFLIALGYAIRMECWNAGILGVRAEINLFNCKKLLPTHHSITPLLHYSNWGEAPKFFDKAMDILILFIFYGQL